MKVPMDCVRGFNRQALFRNLQRRIMAHKTKLDVGGRKTVIGSGNVRNTINQVTQNGHKVACVSR